MSIELELPPAEGVFDLWRAEQQFPLDAIFRPQTVAVIGATERAGSVGRTVLWNLIQTPFGGTVFPVNPKRSNVLGIKAYASIAHVPDPVDLAVVVTPAATVPAVIAECAAVGVRGVIIISAGFKEIGAAGIALEQALMAHRGAMRIIGPNCLGVMNPILGLNATFASTMARPGSVGFISQSGALCTSILDWSFQENIGFSAFVSIGSMLDVSWGDLIYYLGDDPHTKSIVIYMESIGDARSFLSAAREVALSKPIIVLKAGRTEAAAAAATSHTGALAGSDEVLNAAFRRSGVLRVDNISDLFDMAEVLSKQPRLPKGNRLAIVTNAGGPGVIATDAFIEGGGTLAHLAPETVARLDGVLPPHWSHHNPVDILGDGDSMRYAQALEVVAEDPNNDAILVILTPQAMSEPTETAEQLIACARLSAKPILASWMGGESVTPAMQSLNHAGIPTFGYPDTAAHIFNYMWRYSSNLRALYETPVLPSAADEEGPDRARVAEIFAQVRQGDRTVLTEYEAKQVLAAYGIPTVPTEIATSAEEAVAIANQMGYPVVLKLLSEVITHKSDVGGVQLNLSSGEAVHAAYQLIRTNVQHLPDAFMGVTVQPMFRRQGYELILGSSVDAQFGPVILFGTGGQLVEVFGDRALALPPLTSTLAQRMMRQTRIYRALQGVRGNPPVDLEALSQLLVRFSQLVVEQPWIQELDINPLLVSDQYLIALDARIVLGDHPTKPAIRPYPDQYATCFTLHSGAQALIRPIRPEDEPLLVQFHHSLSEESVYMRYTHLVKLQQRIAHDRLTRICFIDYDRDVVLVADHKNPETGQHQFLGVGRLSRAHNSNTAEFAMIISDRHQQQGLGTELIGRLLAIARQEQIEQLSATMLPSNTAMRKICERLGFTVQPLPNEGMLEATLTL
ncbi:MAG: bifunctional acetate--CoA ligase family protein/GNAT family N-acetyltransferase [Oscillatoriales cyanobacterium SM2_2_1]|nr:bifunctional acetate--CoA ligase family protein/GNAT family N-acetyltransferase [Oscillatoriales cyanobacterium SM2_2_1]